MKNSYDNQYGYIGVMISYLERILNIIVNFFSKLGGGSANPPSTDAPSTEATVPETAPTTLVQD